MNSGVFMEKARTAALAAGCQEAELFHAWGKSFEADAQNGEIDRYSVSRSEGVSLRVSLNGKDGYAYTECLEEPEKLAAHGIDNARCLEDGDAHPMQTAQAYPEIKEEAIPLLSLDEGEKAALALRMEKAALAVDSRVVRCVHCAVETGKSGVELSNTKGLSARRERAAAFCYVEPLVQQNGETQTGFAFRMGRDAMDVEGCAKEAVADALSKLGGKPVPSGKYRILLQNMAAADLLHAFCPMFSGDEAQKGRSLLAGKEGRRIMGENITLTDDPFHPVAPRAFDGEGTPCRKKNLVERGRLTTLMHNLKTAAKAGVETTGNARRPSAASSVGVGPSVLLLQPGEDSFETLLGKLGDGLLITDLSGLHAGVDAISGDFSLKASGRRIIGGKDVGAVCRITVAGNLLTLFSGVSALGNDLRFTMPSGGYVAAPSLLVDGLAVAGE